MTCGTVQTGQQFLASALAKIDCHAQAIGAYGYGALSGPDSPTAPVLLASLMLVIALFGGRLMLRGWLDGRELIDLALKIGIVLTIALSWPAWRTVAYQVVINGPAEIAGRIGAASGLPGTGQDQFERLAHADAGIVALTAYGSGRLTGGIVGDTDRGDVSQGIVLADRTGFAWGRIAFLAGTIGPLALVKLAGGILLALAPLMAALLFFAATRAIFNGWLRGLAACALGAVALALIHGVQLALLEGWLAGTLAQRQANLFTVSAPTELLVLGLAFATVTWGVLGLIVRMVFFSGSTWQGIVDRTRDAFPAYAASAATQSEAARPQPQQDQPGRPQLIAEALSRTVRAEQRRLGSNNWAASQGSSYHPDRASDLIQQERLGRSFRRTRPRTSASAQERDTPSG